MLQPENKSIRALSLLAKGFLFGTGWFKSFYSGLPVSGDGRPLPWFTYSSIMFLQERIHSMMDVFEYGCGCSSHWWANRVRSVTSCEHDKLWYEKISKSVPKNLSLHYIELVRGGTYCQFINTFKNTFDIIVIDGRDRVNCSYNCLNALKAGGVIIWDNSDRQEYSEGYEFLKNKGFKKIDFAGMGPVVPHGWCTSIFYKTDNCFGI